MEYILEVKPADLFDDLGVEACQKVRIEAIEYFACAAG